MGIVPSYFCTFPFRIKCLAYIQSKALWGPSSNLPLHTSIQSLNCSILTVGSFPALFPKFQNPTHPLTCPPLFLTFTTQFRHDFLQESLSQALRVGNYPYSSTVALYYLFTGLSFPLNYFLKTNSVTYTYLTLHELCSNRQYVGFNKCYFN